MKALVIAAVAAIAFAPLSLLIITPGVAQAAPCAGDGSNPVSCDHCLYYVQQYQTSNVCYQPAAPRPTQAPPSSAPSPIPEAPLEPVPPPVQITQLAPPVPPPPTAVQPPRINPLPLGAPRSASVATPPKGLEAPPQAVSAAKAAPAVRINPANPPTPPTQVDFDRQVQNVVNAHGGNFDVVRADSQSWPHPRHWDYIDYDVYHRPTLYNPLNQAMTFRYFYDGAYREAYVPAGGRIVLDAAAVGLFPFTAVGNKYLASGSFHGGAWIPPDGWDGPPPPDYIPPAPPEVYKDVAVYVAADNQTVEVGQVQVVGHDNGQPAGSQDTFLLDDSTLAWGQVNDPNSFAQIKVTKTQPLPGVGPTDNGSFLLALVARAEPSQPTQPVQPTWPLMVGYGGLAAAAGLLAWTLNRRKRSTDPFVESPEPARNRTP